jgi:thiamine pyrophosphokinase
MSSHHIVREKQEPALLVLGLNHFTEEDLGQLLEWSPTLIATPPVAEQLTIYGIKVDIVITSDLKEVSQSDVKMIDPEGKTWLDAALAHLVAQGYPAVNIVTDELDLHAYQAYAEQINLVIFYSQQKIYAVTSGFRKWKPAGEMITVLNSNSPIHTGGLQQTGPQQYQTKADGFFSLKFEEKYLFIAEAY